MTLPTNCRRRLGRIRFYAALDKIQKDIDAGFPITAVHDRHDLGMSYSQFTRYVQRFVKPDAHRGSGTQGTSRTSPVPLKATSQRPMNSPLQLDLDTARVNTKAYESRSGNPEVGPRRFDAFGLEPDDKPDRPIVPVGAGESLDSVDERYRGTVGWIYSEETHDARRRLGLRSSASPPRAPKVRTPLPLATESVAKPATDATSSLFSYESMSSKEELI